MANFLRRIILKNLSTTFTIQSSFSSSPFVSNKWRSSKGLEPNPNSYSPLTNLPDYSFLDGRPVILSKTKLNKIKLEKEYCETISKLSYEMEEAVKYHKNKLEKDAEERQKILNRRLKPKGKALEEHSDLSEEKLS